MVEKITLKNALANLPQKTDVDSIVATDASGNPVYIKKSDLAQVVAELIPEATLANKGLMGTSDKSFMPFAMDSSGGKIYLIGSVKQYQMYSILIITPFNNSETATMSLLNTGYGASINPGLKIISGNKIAGKFYYKVDEDNKVMNIYYKAPDINSGPVDIIVSFCNWGTNVKYSEYNGSTENMTEIVLTD